MGVNLSCRTAMLITQLEVEASYALAGAGFSKTERAQDTTRSLTLWAFT